MEPSLLNVRPGNGSKRVEVDHEGVEELPPIPCPVNPKHRLRDASTRPYAVTLRATPDDFVQTDGLDVLISESARGVLTAEGISGWTAEPVRTRYVGPRAGRLGAAPPLWRLVVTGWGGVVPQSAGLRCIPERSCSGCGRASYQGELDLSQLFDPERWDGSDLFIIWPFPRDIWITPRMAELIRARGLTGAHISPFDSPEVGTLEDSARYGVGVRSLSTYMPAERARKIATEWEIG